jgi:hypothetical protein
MKYDFVCKVDPDHPVVMIEHSIKEDHPDLECEVCGEEMIRKYAVPLFAGRTPDGGETIIQYLEYNRKRKKAGMPRFSPYKIRRPPE